MVLRNVASSSSSDRRRGRGGGTAVAGLAVLVGLVAAYLSDCIPGLGAGGSLGTPSSEAPTEPVEPTPRAEPVTAQPDAAGAATPTRMSIAVLAERCRQAQAEPVPCSQVCESLDRARASSTTVEVDATRGSHGAVESLRACLKEAGFSDVRVRSE